MRKQRLIEGLNNSQKIRPDTDGYLPETEVGEGIHQACEQTTLLQCGLIFRRFLFPLGRPKEIIRFLIFHMEDNNMPQNGRQAKA